MEDNGFIKDPVDIDLNNEAYEVASSTIAPFGNIDELEGGFEALNDLFNSTTNEGLKRIINLASLSVDKNNAHGLKIGNDWKTYSGEHDGSKYGLKRVSMRAKSGKNNGRTAVLAAKALLGVGSPIDIPLVHSGFTIRIESQDPYAKTVLYAKLAKLANDAGMSTASLVFSSDHSLFSRVIMDYVSENLISSTLRLPAGKEIMDYILLADDYAIMLGVMSSLFENGFDVVLGCKNTLVVNENSVACQKVIKGKMDPIKALYTDTSRLTDYQNEQLAITKANTIYIDDKHIPDSKKREKETTVYTLDKYRHEESDMVMDKEVIIETNVKGTVRKITIELSSPTYNRYFDFSTRYLSELESLIDQVISSELEEDTRNDLMKDGVSLMVINNSSHYITSIKIDSSKYYDHNDIYDILRSIVADAELTAGILNAIKEFKEESIISIAGTPLYVCSDCKNIVGEANTEHSRSVAAINPYHFFSRLREASA